MMTTSDLEESLWSLVLNQSAIAFMEAKLFVILSRKLIQNSLAMEELLNYKKKLF